MTALATEDATEPMIGLFAASDLSLAAHTNAYGPLPEASGLLDRVHAAGLRGRGGAAFPTAVKMQAVRSAGRSAIVVGNGAEGEPASAKDRSLLAYSPHLVLDGLQLAATVVGAREAYLAVTSGAHAVQAAVNERRDRVRVTVVTVDDRFLIGEETALVSAIEGGRGLPRGRRVPVYQRGVFGRPTLVQNVETLARLAVIARYGGSADRFLATVSGGVRAPGVLDVVAGQSISSVLAAAGGPSEPLSAVLVGGYHGGWVPAAAFDTPLSSDALQPFGASVGAGVVVAFPASRCGIVEAARVASYLAVQSARQCGPCLNGLPALADQLAAVARGHADARGVQALAELVAGRGSCHHPDGVVRFVRSALSVFAAEVTIHVAGRCSRTSTETVLPTPGAIW